MKYSWPRLCANCAWSLWLYRDTTKKYKKECTITIRNDMKMTCSVPCFHWCLAFATIPTSSSAANFVGPKQGTPLAFKASAKPAQSGASGPTKTRATFFSSNLDSDGLNHGTKHGTKHNTYHQTEVWWKGFCFQRIEQPIWRLNHFDMPIIKLKLLCCSSEGRDIAVTNGQVGHPLLSTGCHVLAP